MSPRTTPFFTVWMLGWFAGLTVCLIIGRLDLTFAIYIPMIVLGGFICGKYGTERYT